MQIVFGTGEDREGGVGLAEKLRQRRGRRRTEARQRHQSGDESGKPPRRGRALMGDVGTKKKSIKVLGDLLRNRRMPPELREDIQRAMQSINMRDKKPAK